MTGRTEIRVREIHRRTRRYRRRYENRALYSLTAFSLFLFSGIGFLLRKVQSGGLPTVADSYGSVLLRGGTSAYVVVGIAAFAVGTPPDCTFRKRIPIPAKRSRLHTLKVESTRLSYRFLYCLVRRRISRIRRSVLPVIVNASFRFLFPGSINDPLLPKRHEIQNPST